MWPDPAFDGTGALRFVGVAVLTRPGCALNVALFNVGAAWKFVPVIATNVPWIPTVGLKLLIVGASNDEIVKGFALDEEWPVTVTPIGPLVADDGTVVTICVAVEDVTVPLVPLKVTLF